MAGMDTYCMKVRLSLEVNIKDIQQKLNIIIVNPRIKRLSWNTKATKEIIKKAKKKDNVNTQKKQYK